MFLASGHTKDLLFWTERGKKKDPGAYIKTLNIISDSDSVNKANTDIYV